MFNLTAYRHRVFVSRRIQGRLLLRVGLYWGLYHIVLWHGLLIYHYVQSRVEGTLGAAPVPFRHQFAELARDYSPVLLCGLLTLPVVLIDMLHLSHRIAGPLVQFRSALHDLMEGKRVDRVDLRRRDLLTEFETEFNRYLATLGPNSPMPKPVSTALGSDPADFPFSPENDKPRAAPFADTGVSAAVDFDAPDGLRTPLAAAHTPVLSR